MNLVKKIILSTFIIISCSTNIFSNAIDSLLQKASSVSPQNKNELASLYHQIGLEYHHKESFKDGINYFEKALQLVSKETNPDLYFKINHRLGNTHKRLSNHYEALKFYSNVTESKKEKPSPTLLANTYNHIGSIYNSFGDYDKAYQYQLEAMHYHEILKDTSGIGRDNYAIGSIFFYQGRLDQALEHYEKANQFYHKINNKKLIYSSLAAIGSCYFEMEEIEKSLNFGQKALDIAKELKYKTGIAYSLGNLGSVNAAMGNMKKAKEMMEESLQIKIELKDNWAIIGSHLRLSEIYATCKMPKKALPHLDEALRLSIKINSKTRLLETYQNYEKVYEQLGEYPKAYNFLKKHSILKDSILNTKTVEEMGQAKKRFELEKKENEIELLKAKNHVLEQNKHIQQLKSFIILGFASLLFLCFWLVTSKLKFEKNANLLLGEKNKKIEFQNQELQKTQAMLIEANGKLEENNFEIQSKNKNLKNSNDELENFAYIASHDLKEPLRMISAYTSLLKRKYNTVFDDTGKEFMHFVVDATKRMEIMLDDLLNYSRLNSNKSLDNEVDTNDVLLVVKSNLAKKLEDENAQLIIHHENLQMVKSNQTLMVQLFQNMISNAIKFRSEIDPIVTIDCKREGENYIFSIKDNGIGIKKEYQQKVFDMFKRLHTREEYEGTGIGLATCKKIVNKHGGEIWLTSQESKGTTFYFSLPVPVLELEAIPS